MIVVIVRAGVRVLEEAPNSSWIIVWQAHGHGGFSEVAIERFGEEGTAHRQNEAMDAPSSILANNGDVGVL